MKDIQRTELLYLFIVKKLIIIKPRLVTSFEYLIMI